MVAKTRGLRCLVALCTVGCMLGFAVPALANAPNPIPGTTKVDSESVSNGQVTVTVEGQWNWVTQTNCPTARNGVGYNVAWFDPSDTANPIGGNNSPNGVIDVGTATDNMVHSIYTDGGPSGTLVTSANPFYDGLPTSYLSHNTTSSTPTKTDADNWVSNCNNVDPNTQISSGTWGPISHTYPVGDNGPFLFCPIMYDPHGSGTTSGGKIGSSGVGDLTAGGNGHNNDNSYEGNGQGANGNNCQQLTIPTLTTQAQSAVAVGSPISDKATLNGSSPTGSITWNVYASTDASCTTPLNAQPSTLTTTVNGNGTYSSPTFTPTSAGSYKWVATYSGDGNNAKVSTSCNDPNEVSTVGKVPVKLATSASSASVGGSIQDAAILTGGSNPTGTITWKLYGPGDTSCSTAIQTFTDSSVSGDGTYLSPMFTATSVGTYRWIASYSGDGNNAAESGACNDPNEESTVGKVSPKLTTNAASATLGQPIHDVAHLTGGDNPSGTITWKVYASTDRTCTTPLNSSVLSVAVSGDGDYTSPDFTPPGVGSYEWVATYSGDANNTALSTACGDPNEVSTVTQTNSPGIKVVKLQRDGTSGPYTRNQITASVGDTIYYEIQVTNTGNEPLTLSLSDPHCDSGTISGPISISGTLTGDVLSAGAVAEYTCSHVVTKANEPKFTNVATVTGTPPSGPPVHGRGRVVANITQASIQVVKLEEIAGSGGGFTRGPLTVTEKKDHFVVYTIDYEIQVANTGDVPLTLSLKDPRCDAGTIEGPVVITGTLNGDSLSPGGEAQYTCSHRYVKGDPASFTNVATVTGTPPSGPPVHGTSRVTVKRKSVRPLTNVCRSVKTGKLIHYKKGTKEPRACKPQKPHRPNGFTG
jgi:hypothetical protein